PTSARAGMATVVDACDSVGVIGSRYGVALTTTLMLCPTNSCGAAGLKERSMDWNVRTPADSLVPPRTGGRVTSTRALHGAVRASTVKVTLRWPAATSTVAGVLMQASLLAMASVCVAVTGLPKSTVRLPLRPVARVRTVGEM